jgi:hypothetical protein
VDSYRQRDSCVHVADCDGLVWLSSKNVDVAWAVLHTDTVTQVAAPTQHQVEQAL